MYRDSGLISWFISNRKAGATLCSVHPCRGYPCRQLINVCVFTSRRAQWVWLWGGMFTGGPSPLTPSAWHLLPHLSHGKMIRPFPLLEHLYQALADVYLSANLPGRISESDSLTLVLFFLQTTIYFSLSVAAPPLKGLAISEHASCEPGLLRFLNQNPLPKHAHQP